MATTKFENVLHNVVLEALHSEVTKISQEEIEKAKASIELRLRDSIAKIVLRTQQCYSLERHDQNLVIKVQIPKDL